MFRRHPKKSLGQCFLVDRAAARRIVAALELRPGQPVLEIGPGRGALTDLLIGEAGRIAAVELDRDLAAALSARHDPGELILIDGDILNVDLGDVLRDLSGAAGSRLIVAGNLPYNISKPIAQKLVRDRSHLDRAVLMFQREVAARITASPGTKAYGPLTVLVGRAYEVRVLFHLKPRAFRPSPKVDSSVTLWSRIHDPTFDPVMEARLRVCLKACFARRRRTLRNNLRSALEDDRAASELLTSAGLDGDARAETVPPEGFLRLATLWPTDLPQVRDIDRGL